MRDCLCLQAARALAEDPSTAHLAVDIASWTDEEGTCKHTSSRPAVACDFWGIPESLRVFVSDLGMVGCKSFCGLLEDGALEKASSAGVMAEEVGMEPVVPVGHRLVDAIESAVTTQTIFQCL